MKIVGLMGVAGSGKDTVGDMLVIRHGFVKIALADPMKRALAEWFGWGTDRLWGPSEKRNEPDPVFGGLSARRALQFLGTEIGRELYRDVWIDCALRTIATLTPRLSHYEKERGIVVGGALCNGYAISDVRFANEVEAIQSVGGKVIRIRRPSAGLTDEAAKHLSETEQETISDAKLDAVINNSGSLIDLDADVQATIAALFVV